MCRHLDRAAALSKRPGTAAITVRTPARTAEIPALLRWPVDLIIFDGHCYWEPPKVGMLPLHPSVIRDEHGNGIRAPVFVLGGCGGATEPVRTALRSCLDAPETVLVACRGTAAFEHAESVFPLVVAALAGTGAAPLNELAAGIAWQLSESGAAADGWTVTSTAALPA